MGIFSHDEDASWSDVIYYEEQVKELKAENERLKEENYGLNQELLGYKKGVQASEIIELKQTLQEIKEYAECIGNEEMINGYAIRAKLALWRIAQKITKAEEE